VTNENSASCKRPYTLGKRAEHSDEKRAAVLRAARKLLESGGYSGLTMDSLAKESGVTRQTVHNLFKTKTGVLEALFDQLALDGGLGEMADLMRRGMQQPVPDVLLEGFVKIFTGFWSKDRLLIRRIHGIGAIDPDFGAAVEARNQRREIAATHIVDRLRQMTGDSGEAGRARKIAALYALTSFEFYDALAQKMDSIQGTADAVLALTKGALNSDW
jgi:AcrR family transcriptional regulator